MSKQSVARRIIDWILLLSIVVFGILLFLYKQYIYDLIIGYKYSPSHSMNKIIENVSLTDDSMIVLRATHPKIQTAIDFNESCPRKEAKNYILGCYNNDKIYVYDVKNEDLNEIEEVTLAHELLHAIYKRMSYKEKKSLKPLLLEEYSKIADSKLKQRMDYYKRNEPGEFYNELHSIIGTEFENISPKLEKYYSKIFKNRQKIVKYNKEYNNVFQKLEIDRLEIAKKIKSIKEEYYNEVVEYKNYNEILSTQITIYNRKVNNGFLTYEEAERQRNIFLKKQDKSKEMYQKLSNTKRIYDKLITDYNQKVNEFNKLNHDLDSMNPIQQNGI